MNETQRLRTLAEAEGRINTKEELDAITRDRVARGDWGSRSTDKPLRMALEALPPIGNANPPSPE